ncbi:hypothetical protein F5Y17DRAFT_459892 [Xylariaceae sp. FL0594]|nr:hypothetical protein F5Y17DRAFT_459892 [Xylariaceae sp. FL0594]
MPPIAIPYLCGHQSGIVLDASFFPPFLQNEKIALEKICALVPQPSNCNYIFRLVPGAQLGHLPSELVPVLGPDGKPVTFLSDLFENAFRVPGPPTSRGVGQSPGKTGTSVPTGNKNAQASTKTAGNIKTPASTKTAGNIKTPASTKTPASNKAPASTKATSASVTAPKAPASPAPTVRTEKRKRLRRKVRKEAPYVWTRQALLGSLSKRLQETTGKRHRTKSLDSVLSSGWDMIREKEQEIEALRKKMESLQRYKERHERSRESSPNGRLQRQPSVSTPSSKDSRSRDAAKGYESDKKSPSWRSDRLPTQTKPDQVAKEPRTMPVQAPTKRGRIESENCAHCQQSQSRSHHDRSRTAGTNSIERRIDDTKVASSVKVDGRTGHREMANRQVDANKVSNSANVDRRHGHREMANRQVDEDKVSKSANVDRRTNQVWLGTQCQGQKSSTAAKQEAGTPTGAASVWPQHGSREGWVQPAMNYGGQDKLVTLRKAQQAELTMYGARPPREHRVRH